MRCFWSKLPRTLTGTAGAVALTGNAAALVKTTARVLPATAGAGGLTGRAAVLAQATVLRILVAAPASRRPGDVSHGNGGTWRVIQGLVDVSFAKARSPARGPPPTSSRPTRRAPAG